MSDIASMINITSNAIDGIMKNPVAGTRNNSSSDSATFDGIYNAAINMVTSTNNYLQEAQKAEVAFATGELTSTHELAVIEQKANLSLQYTVAIKNQLLSAYREIMSMQI